MARIARFVVPGLPHHVTQRGKRRERAFFGEDDYALYRDLLARQCRKHAVAVWAYCLMANHVHLILVPDRDEALGRALGETHRRYASVINARLRVTGHLFQSRFGSVVMDEEYLMAAARYVATNPVRARLVERAEDWRWSSVRAHHLGRDDEIVSVAPLLDCCGGRFADLIETAPSAESLSALRAAETIGRPLGSPSFLDSLAAVKGRDPRPKKRGPKQPPNGTSNFSSTPTSATRDTVVVELSEFASADSRGGTMTSSGIPSTSNVDKALRASIHNARRLYDETYDLEFRNPCATRFFLLVIAQEEAAKAFLLYLTKERVVPLTAPVRQAINNHACKHLVGLIMDYMIMHWETIEELKALVSRDFELG